MVLKEALSSGLPIPGDYSLLYLATHDVAATSKFFELCHHQQAARFEIRLFTIFAHCSMVMSSP